MVSGIDKSDLGKTYDRISDDYDLARRLGQADLGETFAAIDRAGESADTEGPEGGA